MKTSKDKYILKCAPEDPEKAKKFFAKETGVNLPTIDLEKPIADSLLHPKGPLMALVKDARDEKNDVIHKKTKVKITSLEAKVAAMNSQIGGLNKNLA